MAATATSTLVERPLLDRARSAIPDYDRLEAARREAAARGRPVPVAHPADVRLELVRATLAAVAAGGDLPDRSAFDEPIREAVEQPGAAAAIAAGWCLVAESLGQHRDHVAKTNPDAALAVVSAELDRIVATVREADAVLGPVSATEDAVNAGNETAEAWRLLTAAVGGYDEVRRAQHELLEIRTSGYTALARAGYYRRAAEVLPDLRKQLGEPVPMVSDGSGEGTGWLHADWPAHDHGAFTVWWPTKDKAAFLRWIVRKADPWVPTTREWAAADAALQKRLDDALARRAVQKTGTGRVDLTPTVTYPDGRVEPAGRPPPTDPYAYVDRPGVSDDV